MDIDTALAIGQTRRCYGHLLSEEEDSILLSSESLEEVNRFIRDKIRKVVKVDCDHYIRKNKGRVVSQ